MGKRFTEYSQFDLSQVNKDVLKKWDENQVFAKSMTERDGCPSFVFFEGPPSANGMPGIHHVMARTIKDIFCRYKTMKGYQVKRKAGWDTHGLPVELSVEKALGITKEDIDIEWTTLMGNPISTKDDQLGIAYVSISENGELVSKRKISFINGAIEIIEDTLNKE